MRKENERDDEDFEDDEGVEESGHYLAGKLWHNLLGSVPHGRGRVMDLEKAGLEYILCLRDATNLDFLPC